MVPGELLKNTMASRSWGSLGPGHQYEKESPQMSLMLSRTVVPKLALAAEPPGRSVKDCCPSSPTRGFVGVGLESIDLQETDKFLSLQFALLRMSQWHLS